jgi:expansin (peptidoglycan-binding protein)
VTASLSPRWLATGGATVLAAALGIALVVQDSGPACAASPTTGKATYFSLDGGLGNCSFPTPPANDLFVAMSPPEYGTAAPCGTYLDVTGPKGKVRVKVIDSCPPCAPGHIDLSLTAFRKIGEPVQGIIPVTYRTVANPPVPGPLSVRLKEGSSQYWLAVLIDNHANRLTSVQIAGAGGPFHTAKREIFNYWTLPSGAGRGPFKIKITDAYGRSTTLPNIKLTPGKTQAARSPERTPQARKTQAPKPTKSTTSPSRSLSSVPPLLESATATATPLPKSAAPFLESATTPVFEPPPAAAVDLAAGSPTSCT